jgi:hypothetical protein
LWRNQWDLRHIFATIRLVASNIRVLNFFLTFHLSQPSMFVYSVHLLTFLF